MRKKSSKKKKFISSLFPSQQKYRDNLKLLVTDKKFQEQVKEIRKYIELPENGIDIEAPNCDELSEAWHHEFYRRSDGMMSNPDFVSELKKYKGLLDNKEISYVEHENLRDTLHQKIPLNYLTRQCNNLTAEFNVPLNSAHALQRYILFNRLDFSPASPFVTSTGSSKDRHERSVSLTFYAKITEADLRSVKRTVNGFFGKNLPKVNPLKNIDTKLAIEKYHQNREVYDHVTDESYRLTAKEIVDNVKADTGKKIKPTDIYEVPRELENLRNKRFRKSGKK